MNEVVRGIVTDNQDPEGMGRVKIKPYLSERETESDWIPVLQGFAGDDRGIFNLPDVEDLVLAIFFDNLYKQGYIMGSMWPEDTPLPASEENSEGDFNGDGNNALRMIRSKSGQRLILDDTEGAEKVQILNPDGTSRFELNGEDESINLLSETDVTITSDTMVSIEAEGMEISLEKDLTVECENLGLEAGGDGTVKASGTVTIEGQGVGIN